MTGGAGGKGMDRIGEVGDRASERQAAGVYGAVRINLPLFSTVVPSSIFMFLSCRPLLF